MASGDPKVAAAAFVAPWVTLFASFLPDLNEVLKLFILIFGLVAAIYSARLKKRAWDHGFLDTVPMPKYKRKDE